MSDLQAALMHQLPGRTSDGDRDRREQERALVTAMFSAARQGRTELSPPHEPPTISHTDLPAPRPESPVSREWNFYRRQAAGLLADGQVGRFVLIKGEAIIGAWDTLEEAEAVALQRYPMQPCLVHQVRSHEPLLRLSPRLQRSLS